MTLDKLRDEFYFLITEDENFNMDKRDYYNRAWADCLRALSEQAGEFDEYSAGKCVAENLRIIPRRRDLAFIDGAKWQFEQDRARIALAESRTEPYFSGRVLVPKLNAEIADLIARLEQAERERDRYRQALERIARKCKEHYWAAIADNALRPKEVILSEEEP